MHTRNILSELSEMLTERGIIATDVMPFCLVNPNHTGHSLGKMLRDLSDDDIAEALGITCVELLSEKASSPTLEDAVGMLMGRNSGVGTGWFVRFYKPSPRGGYSTKLVYAPTMSEAMHRMLQA